MDNLFHQIESIIELIGVGIDLIGVSVIVIGIIAAFFRYIQRSRAHPTIDHYRPFKVRIGRALILGLEILVAADIIKTVAFEPTYNSLGVLGGLILVRTFLSWTLVLEIEGRWPWQSENPDMEVDLTQ